VQKAGAREGGLTPLLHYHYMRLHLLATTLLLATATQAGSPAATNTTSVAVFPARGTNVATIATISYGDEHAPYTFDTTYKDAAPANFYSAEWLNNGVRLCKLVLATNTTQSRLRDLPNVLCTITNRVVRVMGPTTTNEVWLERLGVWCEEVPEPVAHGVYQWFTSPNADLIFTNIYAH
jgi:hypothetical protein